MKDIIKSQGWKSVGHNSDMTYFNATDDISRPTMILEVTGTKVLVNGKTFSEIVIPSLEESKEFLADLS